MATTDPADFVRRFTAWWVDPDPDRLDTTLAADVVLEQPTMPTTRGLPAARASFRRLLDAVPDLSAEVHSWAGHDDVVFIEFTLAGTMGGGPIAWRNVDRFTLGDDGVATHRVNVHDPVGILATVARRPAAWPAFVGLVRPRRAA